ncbi:MAG TPA: YIP1 family protein [Bryobacteraceae bacterium]|jgi:hypothetical protein|nr:YIP1 family protein [Bryobacteraceae bacterium]
MGIVEVFYQPGKLFESLKDRRWAWVLPLIVDILVLAGITIATVQSVGMETILRQRLQTMNLSSEQMQLAMQRSQSPAQVYITYASAVVIAPVTLLVLSGILSIFAIISNRQPRFGTVFSMVSLAFLPYWLITGVMTIAVLLASPDRTSLDITNLLATNPAAFMDKAATSKGLYSFMTSVDALSFFEIGMLSYGFSKITKTSFGSALFAVVSLWIVYVFGKVAVSLLF